jgi:hypothetical protein
MMTINEYRLELLKLAQSGSPAPLTTEQVVEAASQMEKFVFRPDERDNSDSEPR